MPLIGQTSQNLVLNAADYGNNGTAIQTAINKLPSTGGTVFVPLGTWNLSAPLTVPATILSGFKLVGAGWGTILALANSVNDYALKFLGAATGLFGAEISHLKIDGNCANQNSGGGIDANGATNCLFDNLWIHAAYNDCIHIHNGTLTGGFGIQSYVMNCLFDNGSGSGGNGRGLSLDSTDQCIVIGNVFRELGGTGGSDAFCIRDQNGLARVIGNIFTNNLGANQGGGGIKSYSNFISIIGNQFESLAAGNVVLLGNKHIVSGNQFLNIGKGAGVANSAAGIYTNSNYSIISSNYFNSDGSGVTNGTEAFIYLDSNTTGNIICDNQFDTSNGGSGYPNIRLGSNTSNRIGRNIGWTTEASGSANITSAITSVTVSHGLSATPTLQQINVTPQTSLGSAARFWVSNATSSNFTINVDATPGSTISFGWRISTEF